MSFGFGLFYENNSFFSRIALDQFIYCLISDRLYKPPGCISPVDSTKQRQSALHNVFKYLGTSDLLNVGKVCSEWREVSKHPDLWKTLKLGKARMGSKVRICAGRVG